MPIVPHLLAPPAARLPGARGADRGAAPAQRTGVFPFAVRERSLPNGLNIVVVPFDSPGLVTYWTVVRAGSRNEIEPGKSGFAHFFEHMMFRGTERYPRQRYNDILKGLGSDHNAFTTDDYTAFHILAPAASLETLMTIEADRFMKLKYPVEDFRTEAGAVLGEYYKSAAHPFQKMREMLHDMAFTTHTYKHTTIGFLKDIQDMPNQYEHSLHFFDRYYRPEHCILLVVGDVDATAVFDLAERYYGGWEQGRHRFEVAAEPPQNTEKRAEAAWPGPTQPYILAGYHGPAFSTTAIDLPALDLIAQLLFSGAAPLYQKLVVEEQVADVLTGGAADHRDPCLFTILARAKRDADLAGVEAAVSGALKDLQTGLVPEDRLQRVKSHMRYSYAMGLDTAENVARSLAHYLALTGDADAVNQVHALYERVTPEDLRDVARRYFETCNRTTVVLRQAVGGEREPGGEPRPPSTQQPDGRRA